MRSQEWQWKIHAGDVPFVIPIKIDRAEEPTSDIVLQATILTMLKRKGANRRIVFVEPLGQLSENPSNIVAAGVLHT